MVKSTGRGLVVKRPGVLSKVQILTLVLGVGVFSLLPIFTVADLLRTFRSVGCHTGHFVMLDSGLSEELEGNPSRTYDSGPHPSKLLPLDLIWTRF